MGVRSGWGHIGAAAVLVGLVSGCAGGAPAGSPARTHAPAAVGSPVAAATSASPDTKEGKPAGVIFAALQDQDWIVVSVDPATGRADQIADFLPNADDVKLDPDYANHTDGGPLAQRALFSADLTRAVALRTLSNGATDIGWVDRTGDFTDVTAATATSTGFTSTTSDDTPAFGPDGAFYFARRVPDGTSYATNPTIWRLDGADPASAHPVATLDQVNYYIDAPSRVMPLCADCVPFRSPAGQSRGAFRATDFIGTGSYLSTDDNGSMVYLSPLQAESDTTLMDWGTDGKQLIPQTNRTVWSPVASPDGTQVAFLSKSQSDASDPRIPPQLFVVPAQGGVPRQVSVGPDTDSLGGKSPTLLAWM
jgi:hypothetical protein